jgi:hypothetical protein
MFILPIIAIMACGLGTDNTDTPPSPIPPSKVPDTPVPSNTPAPTNTPEPTETPLPTFLDISDELGDGLDCRTGVLLDTPTPPDVDITMVHVEIMPDVFHVDVEIGGVDALVNPLFGGVEFLDVSTDNSETDPNWYFNGRGNKNFSFGSSPPSFFTEFHVFDPSLGWFTETETDFTAMIDGNHILFDIPIGEVPPDSPFYISVTNFSACDASGLTPDGVPELFLPLP